MQESLSLYEPDFSLSSPGAGSTESVAIDSTGVAIDSTVDRHTHKFKTHPHHGSVFSFFLLSLAIVSLEQVAIAAVGTILFQDGRLCDAGLDSADTQNVGRMGTRPPRSIDHGGCAW